MTEVAVTLGTPCKECGRHLAGVTQDKRTDLAEVLTCMIGDRCTIHHGRVRFLAHAPQAEARELCPTSFAVQCRIHGRRLVKAFFY